jgi:arylsulfatase A-like enzyme
VKKISDEEMRRYYLANLNCLDDNIGRLLDVLEDLKLVENTLIIFISDNGGEPLTGANNRPLCGSKYTMHEGGIRVPFIISWPKNLPQGIVYEHRVSALDIVPTCIEAAGIKTIDPRHFDGANMIKSIQKNIPTKAAKNPLYFKFGKHWAIIDDKWKLVYTDDYNPLKRPITSQILLGNHNNRIALFDLENDPAERFNLIDLETHIARDLKEKFEKWLDSMRSDHQNYQFSDGHTKAF